MAKNENEQGEPGPAQSQLKTPMVRCAVIPEVVYHLWLDSYRDALVPPKTSQPVLDALKQVQFGSFPVGGPLK